MELRILRRLASCVLQTSSRSLVMRLTGALWTRIKVAAGVAWKQARISWLTELNLHDHYDNIEDTYK